MRYAMGNDLPEANTKLQRFLQRYTNTLTLPAGILTALGRPRVVHVSPLCGDADAALARAIRAESTSDHPLGKALLEYAGEVGIKPVPCTDVQTLKGLGLRAEADGKAPGQHLKDPPAAQRKLWSAGGSFCFYFRFSRR